MAPNLFPPNAGNYTQANNCSVLVINNVTTAIIVSFYFDIANNAITLYIFLNPTDHAAALSLLYTWRMQSASLLPGQQPVINPAPYAMYGNFLSHAYRGMETVATAADMRSSATVMNDVLLRSSFYKQTVTSSLAAAYQRGLYRYHPYLPSDRVRSPDT